MKNKKILVTGGAGFIGSHLVKKLLNCEADVSTLVKYKSIIDNPRLSAVWDQITVYEADLRNIDSLRQFDKINFDYIFHLAAYNHVGDAKKIIGDTKGCFIVSYDPSDIADKLTKVLEFSSKTCGRQRIKKLELDSHTISKKVKHVYKKVINIQ